MRILFIFRRDFRSIDNIGLNSCKNHEIYPVFIFTPEQIENKNKYKSDNCVQFMIESLIELKKHINITFCYGHLEEVIEDIVKKNKIDSIRCNTDYTPYAIKREKRMETLAKRLNVEFIYYHDILLFEPSTIRNQSGSFYQKYTPFYNYVIKQKVLEPTKNKSFNIKKIDSKYMIESSKLHDFYTKNEGISVHGGRSNAILVLKNVKTFSSYNATRNYLHIDTTKLSAYLKFGCVSIRECFYAMKKIGNIKSDLIRQLIWREFYYHLGYGFTERFGNSLKPKYDNIKWENDMIKFKAWCNGKTGYPIVDSCMVQLNTLGWMHNRGRLIVASFLIKNLQVDWRYGEKYFAQKLVDYDPLVNQGNWQWVAGSGADSQPYFRVFNPWLQSAKFDKDAIYIKKWLPQLNEVEPKHLHQWDKYNELYDIKKLSYYKPIVDYSKSKKEGLARYAKYL